MKTTGADVGTCRVHACATITYALSVATQNSTIEVGAGTYAEQVVVTKSVSIVGATGEKTVIEPTSLATSATDPDRGNTVFPIVDVTPGVTANLKNLAINGTMAQGQFTSCAVDYAGVFYKDASGAMLDVAVNNIALPTALFGCQQGLAVYVISDPSSSSDVSMNTVSVSGFDKNGITCKDPGTTCSIVHSTVTGAGPTPLIAQNGIEMLSVGTGSILTSTVTGDSYTGGGNGNQASGLLLFDPGTLSVNGNTITNSDVNVYLGSDGAGPTAGTWILHQNKILGATDNVPGGEAFYGDGVELDSTTNTALSLTDNTVETSAEDGISLLGASHVTLNGNTVALNKANGIELGGNGSSTDLVSSSNAVLHNAVRNSGADGIVADAGSTTNTVHANATSNNLRFDLEDLGTGNVWTSNTCVPASDSSPSGLCH